MPAYLQPTTTPPTDLGIMDFSTNIVIASQNFTISDNAKKYSFL